MLLVPTRPCPSSSSSCSSSTSTDAGRPDTLSTHARASLWAGPRRADPPSASRPRPIRGAAGSYCRLGGRGRRGFPLGPLSESRDPGGKAPTPERRPSPAAVLHREWAAAGGELSWGWAWARAGRWRRAGPSGRAGRNLLGGQRWESPGPEAGGRASLGLPASPFRYFGRSVPLGRGVLVILAVPRWMQRATV